MLEVDDVGTPGTCSDHVTEEKYGAAPPIDNYADVSRTDNKSWSLYGAAWLQPAATGCKSADVRNRRKQAKTVAVGCDRSPSECREDAHSRSAHARPLYSVT
jgi:hypothetical protein